MFLYLVMIPCNLLQLQMIPLKNATKYLIASFVQGTLLAHTFCYSLRNEVMCFVYCCGICVCVNVFVRVCIVHLEDPLQLLIYRIRLKAAAAAVVKTVAISP